MLESPENVVLSTSNSAVAYAEQHVHVTAQSDAHLAAGGTVAGISGDATSLYAAAGGIKAIANQGPVSVEAHGSSMQIIADQSVRIASTDEHVEVLAKDAIVLQQGPSRITLKGGDILIETTGQFTLKAGSHAFVGPGSQSPLLPALPVAAPLALYDEQLHFVNAQGMPLSNVSYQLKLADGTAASGVTDDEGKTERIVTQTPVAIESAALTPPQMAACCTRMSNASPEQVEVKTDGVQTNDVDVGSSVKTVTIKGHERSLTAGEIEMARTVFQDSIDYDKVRVHKGSFIWFDLQSKRTAITPNGHMYFREEDFQEDFSAPSIASMNKGWFMHEMTHVWQYQLGYSVILHGLFVTIRGHSAYEYKIDIDSVFHDYNMEQQGDIVSDYFAIHIEKNYKVIYHRGTIGTPEQLSWVTAPLLKDPKNADNLPK